MAWFGLKKRENDVLDLTERYRKQQEKIQEMKEDSTESSTESVPGAIGIFGMSSTTTSSGDSDAVDLGTGIGDKRRKLAKRLMDMTEKIEELGNQIYHLQQRLEVLEKKGGVGSSGGFGVFN